MPSSEPSSGPSPGPPPASGGVAAARADSVGLVASQENRSYLRGYLLSRHPGLDGQDAEDIIEDVLIRLVGRITDGSWTPVPHEPRIRAYLRNAAHWAVVDFHRSARRTRESPVPTEDLHDLLLTDDEAVARLSRDATTESVRAALRRIRDSGDATAFVVVTAILDHIQRTGEQPSNRQTGAACGLSHTAVANALARLRPSFEQAREVARDG